MVRDYIEYDEKEYQLSTVLLYDCEFETVVLPIENGVVSGSEVYKFRTFDAGKSRRKHKDILDNLENYISKEAIDRYLKKKRRMVQ